GPFDGTAYFRPSDKDRKRPGQATPNNVLFGATFENNRVDDHVKEDGRNAKCSGQPVRSDGQNTNRSKRQNPGEDQRFSRGDFTCYQRTVLGALHVLINVTVDIAITRTGSSSSQSTTNHGRQDRQQVRPATLRNNHRWQGGDQ